MFTICEPFYNYQIKLRMRPLLAVEWHEPIPLILHVSTGPLRLYTSQFEKKVRMTIPMSILDSCRTSNVSLFFFFSCLVLLRVTVPHRSQLFVAAFLPPQPIRHNNVSRLTYATLTTDYMYNESLMQPPIVTGNKKPKVSYFQFFLLRWRADIIQMIDRRTGRDSGGRGREDYKD